MRRLSEAEILEVWERGQGRGAEHQALAPLLVASPGRPAEELARLPVGERDEALLDLRRLTLGSLLQGSALCPGCGLTVDFAVEVEAVLAAGRGAQGGAQGGAIALSVAGVELSLRPLDSLDLAFAGAAPSLAEARRRLVERAVVSAERDGEPVAAADLPEAAVAALAEALEARDPLAVVPLAMACGRCGRSWQPLLEVAGFVWRELAARAERTMSDVDALARTYGWSESTILALSPARRQFYLELAPAERARGAGGEADGRTP